MLSFLIFVCFLLSAEQLTAAQEWRLPQTGQAQIILSENRELSSSKNLYPGHSCFTAKMNSRTTLNFCYPMLFVSGIPKAGTSAMYELLEEHPHFAGYKTKELCLDHSTQADTIYEFFLQLQRQTENALIGRDAPQILISGCIHAKSNAETHLLLHRPNSFYLLMARDMSDLLWATYNFWCGEAFDGAEHCKPGGWTNPQYHYRSPEMFHELVVAQSKGLSFKFSPQPLKHVVFHGNSSDGPIKNYVEILTGGGVDADRVFLFANEELSEDPHTIWEKLVSKLHLKQPFTKHPRLHNFEGIRVNTGDKRGANKLSNSQSYVPGLYTASGHRPMLNKTRELIRKGWVEDCLYTSNMTGYRYPACH